MTQEARPGFFWPYDSDQEIYAEKIPPELGVVPSKWRMTISSWRFLHAENRDLVPIGFSDSNYDDAKWDHITIPSVWQTEGYGAPSDLSYDAASQEQDRKFGKRLATRLSQVSAGETDDDVGVYRAWVDLPEIYEERVVYFCASGIRGRFELFVNGRFVTGSSAVYSMHRFIMSSFLLPGRNQMTVLVYRLDGGKHGKIRSENGTFGMSGIFRVPEIIAEPEIEITSAKIETTLTADHGYSVASDTEGSTPADTDVALYSLDSQRTNATVTVLLSLRNHTDVPSPVQVTASLLEARTEYDLYDLPVHLPVAFTMEGSLSAGSDLLLEAKFDAASVLMWSDCHPFLYDLVLYLVDKNHHVICVKRIRFGFRTTETIGKVFHVNHTPMPIRAVRYFSFDPEGGLSVRPQRMVRDILLMKRAGINTVLVAHIPADPLFYRMCDHYGLYIISQAERYAMADMIDSLSLHPSIMMWSFAPLTYDEHKLFLLKQKLLLKDTTRPFFCEKDKTSAVSDMLMFPNEAGRLFGEWCDLALFRIPIQQKTQSGTSIFSSIQGRAKREGDDKPYQYIHQADLVEEHDNTLVPIAQGIVAADRTVHPIYHQIKKQCETILITRDPEEGNAFTVANLHPIGSTRDLILEWDLLLDGLRIKGGRGELPSILPLGKQKIVLPLDTAAFLKKDWIDKDTSRAKIFASAVSKELTLSIRLKLKDNAPYAPAGFEVAFFEQVLLDKVEGEKESSLTRRAEKDIEILTKPEALAVRSAKLSASFSRDAGSLLSLFLLGKDVLADTVIPSFYRAATNADRSDHAFALASTVYSRETDWRQMQKILRFRRFSYEMDGEDFSLIAHYSSVATKGEILMQYLLGKDGTLRITLAFTPKYDLVRCGIRLSLPKEFQHIRWYGLGPDETYFDRKEAAKIGRFDADTKDMYHAYARPQENGGHCDTRYLILSDGEERRLLVSSEEPEGFSFTATFYAPEEIDDSVHQEEMTETDHVLLFLDFYHRGIERTGKETSNFVKNKLYRGTFIFEPYGSDGQEAFSDRSVL